MSSSVAIPWYREPTREQWLAYVAAWLGWTLDAFDFTIFLLIMVPIANEFHVPLVDVTAVFTVTLWLRLVGATASGSVRSCTNWDFWQPMTVPGGVERNALSGMWLEVCA